MTTIEKQLMQIFERKKWFVEQMRNQSLQFDQLLASKLLIHGINPPSWLWPPPFPSQSSHRKELNKEEFISGLLYPRLQPTVSCSSSHYSLYNNQRIITDHGELPEGSVGEVRASSVGLVVGDRQSASPECLPSDPACAFNPIREQDASAMSPYRQIDTQKSDICPDPSQSLARIQRSKSRQRALQVRNSVKASKSSSQDVNHYNIGAVKAPAIALLHSDHQNESELLKPIEINNKRSEQDGNVDNCGSKETDRTRAQVDGKLMQISNYVAEVSIPANCSYSNEYFGVEGKKTGYQSCQVKGRNTSGSMKRSRTSSSEPDFVIESLKSNGYQDGAGKSLQESNHIDEVDELFRRSCCPLGQQIFEKRDGSANKSSTFKHLEVLTQVDDSSPQLSKSGKTIMGLHKSPKAARGCFNGESQAATECSDELKELEEKEKDAINSGRIRKSSSSSQRRSSAEATWGMDNSLSSRNEISGTFQFLGKSAQTSNNANELLGQSSSSPKSKEMLQVGEVKIEDHRSTEKGSIASCRITRAQSSSLWPDRVNKSLKYKNFSHNGKKDCAVESLQDPVTVDGLKGSVNRKMEYCQSKKNGSIVYAVDGKKDCARLSLQEPVTADGPKELVNEKSNSNAYAGRMTRSRTSGKQPTSANVNLNMENSSYISNASDQILAHPIDASTRASSHNELLESLKFCPIFNENHEITEAVGVYMNSGKPAGAAIIRRSGATNLLPDVVSESEKNGCFTNKGKEDGDQESLQEPENSSQSKELLGKRDYCSVKEKDSSSLSGRIKRSRTTGEQSNFAKEILNLKSCVPNENENKLAQFSGDFMEASNHVNDLMEQRSPYLTSSEKQTSVAIITRSGPSNALTDIVSESEKNGCSTNRGKEDGVPSSLQEPDNNGESKELLRKKDYCCIKEADSSSFAGRIKRSIPSGKQPTLAREILNMESCVANENEKKLTHFIGYLAEASNHVNDLVEHPSPYLISRENGAVLEAKVKDHSRNEKRSCPFGNMLTYASSSLQPDCVNESSHDKKNCATESIDELNHLVELRDGSSCNPQDEHVLEERGGSANHFFSCIYTDVVTGTTDSMPVFESFVMDTDVQLHIPGSGIVSKESNNSNNATDHLGPIEKVCKSSCLHTPSVHALTTYKLDKAKTVYQSVPNGLLEGMSPRITLSMDDSTGQDFSGASYLNREVNRFFNGTSYSDCLPCSTGESSWDIKKPCTSPVRTIWDRISSISSSSGKKRSLNLELPSIREENENADGVADTFQGVGSDMTVSSAKREPLADITENSNLPPIVSETDVYLGRSSLESVNTEINFTGTCQKAKKKVVSHSGKGRDPTKTKQNQNVSLGASVRRANGSLHSRFSKSRALGKTSLKEGGRSCVEKDTKPNNIVSNVTSFVPLVQRKQATAAPTGKRDIKVKALEAAEAAKRLAEEKENERKMKKEALKLERARQKQENLRQLELQKKKKEEEQKKKEAEMAARKRQREEEERKEKERKRKRMEEARKQLPGPEEKICPEKGNNNLKYGATDGAQCRKKAKDEAGKQRRLEEERVEKEVQNTPETGRTTLECVEHAARDRDSCVLFDHHGSLRVADHIKMTSNTDTASQNSNVVMNTREQSYEMSPFQPSDDEYEDEDEDVPNTKLIPSWASKSSVAVAVLSQQGINPDLIFPPESFCNIGEVCLPRRLQL